MTDEEIYQNWRNKEKSKSDFCQIKEKVMTLDEAILIQAELDVIGIKISIGVNQ